MEGGDTTVRTLLEVHAVIAGVGSCQRLGGGTGRRRRVADAGVVERTVGRTASRIEGASVGHVEGAV